MPWKNGLGVTTQLAIHPEGASTDTFEWRVSIARLDATAPFSAFDGIERCLVMLEGEMTLVRANEPPLTLTDESAPIRFSGSVPAEGRVTGTAFDLNLMYRHDRWHATMRRIKGHAGMSVRADADAMLCSRQAWRVGVEGRTFECEKFDMLRSDGPVQFEAISDIDAYLIQVKRQP